ncbi:MAG: hypothetical protein EXX96DRAFT_471668 [Benjaminiella poitrasii]|nr:MAG: hypothetical protein EXX96DRAFT_471668 [Benjaminiella poitrasii]
MTDTTTYCWSYCYLFAREKIVAQCRKDHELPDEFIYFLKLSVSRYLQESMASQYNHTRTTIDNTTLPQNISNSTMTTSYDLTSPSSSTTNSSSQPSSLAYVYDANSNSMPFRIREKATSSVTVISSDLSFFSSTTQQHHSSPVKALDIHDRSSFDSPSMDDVSFLSSSLPPEDISSSDTSQKHQSLSMKNERTSSAPSSPRLRSRSHSFTNTTREDSSLKHMLSSLINGELSHLDQIEDVKLIRRWLKIDGHICLANLIFVLLSEGLSAVVIYRDEVRCKSEKKRYTSKSLSSSWKPTSSQVKRFKTSLKSCLSDFNTFLLTKEATHFTNISFAVTYPGLVHFIYFDKGIMTAPSLVDLNELDKNHELLHEVYEKYSTDQYKWFWPDEVDLKKLASLIYRHDSFKIKALEESVDHQYYFVYQKGPNHQELLAIYFTIIPTDRLWSMHQKLFYDISQRST